MMIDAIQSKHLPASNSALCHTYCYQRQTHHCVKLLLDNITELSLWCKHRSQIILPLSTTAKALLQISIQ